MIDWTIFFIHQLNFCAWSRHNVHYKFFYLILLITQSFILNKSISNLVFTSVFCLFIIVLIKIFIFIGYACCSLVSLHYSFLFIYLFEIKSIQLKDLILFCLPLQFVYVFMNLFLKFNARDKKNHSSVSFILKLQFTWSFSINRNIFMCCAYLQE